MVSGLHPATDSPYSDSISLRLPYSVNLATECKSLTHYTKGTQSPLRAPTFCKHAVSGSISLPSQGFFSPFPHGTGSLSVTREYLALGDGPPGFRRNFSCSAVLRILVELIWISHTGLLPYVAQLSSWLLLSIAVSCPSPTTPKSKLFGLGFSRFARRY